MILATGSNGLLGKELQQCWDPDFPVLWSTRTDMDIADPASVWSFLMEARPRTILHLAAWTDVAGAETNRTACWKVNVEGTRNLVQAAKFIGSRIIYVSTDYVFDGERGSYEPTDAPNPLNYYALTKLMGEGLVSTASSSLIVRTSFKKRVFEHPAACVDMWTSADYVDVIAPLLRDVVLGGYTGIYHLGTGRKSVLELARKRSPDVNGICRSDIKSVALPGDVSFGKTAHMDWPSF